MLPGKFLRIDDTPLGRGVVILRLLDKGAVPVGQLFLLSKEIRSEMTYDEYLEALTFLYIADAVEEVSGMIVKRQHA